MNIGVAFKAFFKAIFDNDFAGKVAELFQPSQQKELLPKPQVDPGAVRLLALLQREGRLLDFLQEDLEEASDAQIGAVVRSTVYTGCRKAIQEYLTVEPVRTENENDTITVEEGFNPNEIRLVGKVEGEPPFTGVLRHKGWKLTKANLPANGDDGLSTVVCPAELEL